MDHGRTKVLLVEVSGAQHIGYPYRDVVECDTLEGRPEGRTVCAGAAIAARPWINWRRLTLPRS
jgi:hypothetical protein